ncbi:hypothetical protein ACFU7T_10425 [Streptomyces sp. NPDC057555]|uniref:hypothetical protein n=1 Tax=Streptomyces sp. NPDC057555 TaxID=3346166 RepID=UPI00369081F6
MPKSGVGFLVWFGLGWWLLGTSAFAGATRLILIVAGCAGALALHVTARRFLPAPEGDSLPADRRRRFRQVNVVQWLLIAVVVMGCVSAGVPVLVPPLVAVVVGLHFLPLVAVFEQPRFQVPAALLVAAGAAGGAVWLAGGPDDAVRLVVGCLCALSLWGVGTWAVAGAASVVGRTAGGQPAER